MNDQTQDEVQKTEPPAPPKVKVLDKELDFAQIVPLKMRFFRRLNEERVLEGARGAGGQFEITLDKVFPFVLVLIWETMPDASREDVMKYADNMSMQDMQRVQEWAQYAMGGSGVDEIDRPI